MAQFTTPQSFGVLTDFIHFSSWDAEEYAENSIYSWYEEKANLGNKFPALNGIRESSQGKPSLRKGNISKAVSHLCTHSTAFTIKARKGKMLTSHFSK